MWRLDRIAKDGALHKKLIKAEIVTVEDFLRLLVKDPQRLRSVSITSYLVNFNHYFSLGSVGFVFVFHLLFLVSIFLNAGPWERYVQ